MSYQSGEEARLLVRTIRGSLDFSGRSRRTEMILYGFATVLVGVMVAFPLMILLPFAWGDKLPTFLSVTFSIPTVALFVRRLHDHGKSAWWALAAIPLWTRQIYMAWLSLTDRTAYFEATFHPGALLSAGLTVLSIAVLILSFWPGTAGDNAYGADPRIEIEPGQQAA